MSRGPRFAVHRGDLVAGVSVALVLIPQSMAYATLAGMPPERGLYAAALAPLAAVVHASSPYLQTGPTAITSLLTLGALTTVAEPLTPAYLTLAAMLALLVGVIRVVTGLLRAGTLAYLMSQPVILGFSSAAGILIIFSQVPAVLGVRTDADHPIVAGASALLQPSAWNLGAMAFALIALVLVFGARRIHPLLPGSLLAAGVGVVTSILTGYAGPTVGAIDPGLPLLSLDVSWTMTTALLLPAGVIAILGFAEPASIARRYAMAERSNWDPDREFISQGTANLVSGVIGAFPTGGSFSRSALNKLAGARTRWSGVITGLFVLAFLPFMWILAPLPSAVLAAIVMAAVTSLVALPTLWGVWRTARLQTGVALACFAATLISAPHVERGVLVGVGGAIAAHLWRERSVSTVKEVRGGAVHVRPNGVLFFFSAARLERDVRGMLADHRDARRLVVHLDGLGRIDYTGALALRDLLADAQAAGLEVELRDVPAHARRIIGSVFTNDSSILSDEYPEDPSSARTPV